MHDWLKRWGWPLLKAALTVLILVSIGLRFYSDLQRPGELSSLEMRPGWLVASGALYLLALAFSAGLWHRLMHLFGQRPALLTTLRAYYIGHLGKYVPGKALALLMRGSLVSGPEVRLVAAIITAFYEVLATMAAGAMLAALVFVWQPPALAEEMWHPALTGLVLLVVCVVPLLPGVFNFLVRRLAARFERVESLRLPPLRFGALLSGLALTSCGWALMGLSLWALLQAVLPDPPDLAPDSWVGYTGAIALGYVAGFVVLVVPGGVGVREFLLQALLLPLAPRAVVVAAVLLLRLVWTAAELVLAALLYFLPTQQSALPTVEKPSQ